jgi:hypothetical protein
LHGPSCRDTFFPTKVFRSKSCPHEFHRAIRPPA